MTTYTCPACGFPGLLESPRLSDGGGSYESCLSCGFEYGYTDDDQGETYETWRARWVNEGFPWCGMESNPQPTGWNPRAQLQTFLDSQRNDHE